MEKLFLRKISPALGFEDTQQSTSQKTTAKDSEELLPPPALKNIRPAKLNLEDPNSYQYLLSTLENPWLGEDQKEEPDISFSKPAPVKPLIQQKLIKPSLKPAVKKYSVLSPVSMLSLTVDSALAGFLFFSPLLTFTFLTHSAPWTIFTAFKWEIALCFFCFYQIYSLNCRLFCFETYGEALAKRRLVQKPNNPAHPLLLFWRSLIICLTGFVILPISSVILKKDLLGSLTSLYFKKV